jgi:hypothetical protein
MKNKIHERSLLISYITKMDTACDVCLSGIVTIVLKTTSGNFTNWCSKCHDYETKCVTRNVRAAVVVENEGKKIVEWCEICESTSLDEKVKLKLDNNKICDTIYGSYFQQDIRESIPSSFEMITANTNIIKPLLFPIDLYNMVITIRTRTAPDVNLD